MPFLKFNHVWYTPDEFDPRHLQMCQLQESSNYFGNNNNFRCQQQSKTHNFVLKTEHNLFGFPKGYAALNMAFKDNDENTNRSVEGGRWAKEVEFRGTLDPQKCQPESLKKTLQMLEDSHSGGAVLCLPCGYGKTVVALALAQILGRKTFVLCHTTFLQNQWRDRIKTFLPRARVCLATSKQELDQDKFAHITIGLMQSVAKIDKELLCKNYGLMIVDEAHHLPCATLRSVICKFNTRYTLALTATPHGRSDGLQKYIFWAIGEISAYIKAEYPNVKVMIVSHTSLYLPHLSFEDRLMTDQSRNDRIRMIITKVVSILKTKVLVLTLRRHHVQVLNQSFLEYGVNSCAMLGGETHDLKLIAQKDVVVATFQLVSEGFDMPDLDTLLLGMPKSDLTQVIGRITRQKNKNTPWVIDLVDQCDTGKKKFRARKSIYKSLNMALMNSNY